MSPYEFNHNKYPTIGVELELQLVDAQTMALRSAFPQIMDEIPIDYHARIKPELMECYLEINTDVCTTVAEVEADLREKIQVVERAAAKHDVKLFWAATHPFSPWIEQKISDNPRYHELVEQMQETAKRLVTFGLHVHVGVDTGDKAVMICDRIMRHLPTLLALSANSPFWSGRNTGLHTQRVKVMEGLPTAGLPPLMRNWSEYVWLLRTMVETRFIKTIREIWWDVRPHHNFGTVEVRICDMPPNLNAVLAITALVQCLIHSLSQEIERGTYLYDCHPMMVRQNKWRATRYGLGANLIDPYTQESKSAQQIVKGLVEHLRTCADTLDCAPYLEDVWTMAEQPNGAQRQIEIYQKTHDMTEVVRQLVAESALSRS